MSKGFIWWASFETRGKKESCHMICSRKALQPVLQFMKILWYCWCPDFSLLGLCAATGSGGKFTQVPVRTELAGHCLTPNSFCRRAFSPRCDGDDQNLAKLRPAADTSLYRDPYYNGIWEIQCKFWWFFESVGSHKRSQTLPAITSDNKYICNIKIKNKIFSTWFSSDYEIDLHLKKWWFLQ